MPPEKKIFKLFLVLGSNMKGEFFNRSPIY
jgi:hypothetical protein